MSGILVIGGSYFIGKVFVLKACENLEISTVNRGRNPLKLDGVREIICDRHDDSRFGELFGKSEFEAVIDFCAYNPGDIKSLIEAAPGLTGHYIYISSCSVFKPSEVYPKTGEAELNRQRTEGPVGEYAYNKMLLEKELEESCTAAGIQWTIIRPSFVYGPYNYAPRESWFFKKILSGDLVQFPEDCGTLSSFVYVSDIAELLKKAAANSLVFSKSYNLAAEEMISYGRLEQVLKEVSDIDFGTEYMPVRKVIEDRIPLPFPLEGHELFSGAKISSLLEYDYTPFMEGMKKSFDFYRKYVFRS